MASKPKYNVLVGTKVLADAFPSIASVKTRVEETVYLTSRQVANWTKGSKEGVLNYNIFTVDGEDVRTVEVRLFPLSTTGR